MIKVTKFQTPVSTLFLFFFMLLSIYLPACEEKIKPAVTKTNYAANIPVQESWNSRITLSKEGKLVAIVTAGYIAVYNDQQNTILENGVKVEFFNDIGENTSVLTSEKGVVYNSRHDLEASGNVIVITDSGQTTLKTNTLQWSNNTKKIYTKEYVEIDSPTEKIRGFGFESDQNLKNYKIFKVTGQVENIK